MTKETIMAKTDSPALMQARKANRQRGNRTRAAIQEILDSATGPVTTREVTHALYTRGMNFESTHVRAVLYGLVEAGTAVTREESPDERVIRNGGFAGRGLNAVYFFKAGKAGKLSRVPFRTEAETAPSITKPKAKSKAKGTSTKPKSSARKAYSLDSLLEQLIHQHTGDLIRENEELKKQLAQIKSLLSK